MFRRIALATVGMLAAVPMASAHIDLERQEAAVGGAYKAVMRVNHGCDGSATVSLRVRLPTGVVAVRPMPKPGWKLDVVNGKYAKPVSLRGAAISQGVTELKWSGGSLPDAFYDEFVFTGTLSDDLKPGEMLYFPVVQECEKGVNRWIEIPTGDHGGREEHGAGTSEPAPGLKLLPARR